MSAISPNLRHIESLVEIVSRLRGPGGCPWDQKQTHESLTQYAIEETHELVEALEQESHSGKDQNIKEELGDVLFQVILHAQLASERGAFNLADVIEAVSEKLVRRHPHVFGDTSVVDAEDVVKKWDEIKIQEKALKREKAKALAVDSSSSNSSVATAAISTSAHSSPSATSVSSSPTYDASSFELNVPPMPALQRAYKIGKRTEKLRFDWNTAEEAMVKVEEEFGELREALDSDVTAEIEYELGDVLFSLAQLGRHLQMDPEQVLRKGNRRFEKRFNKMIEMAQSENVDWAGLDLDGKDVYWRKAKAFLKGNP